MAVPKYRAKITIDGDELLDWTSFTVSHRLGIAEKSFDVQIERPIELNTGSTCSISDGYGDSDVNLKALITDREIESDRVASRFEAQNTSIGGIGTDLTRKAPKKSLFYINKAWLDAVAGNNYVIQDGVIYKSDPGDDPYRVNGVCIFRLMINHLPGRDLKDNQIECIVESGWTYHSIARNLAQRAGYYVDIGVPNLDLQKSFMVSADSPYFGAIAGLFSKWNPMIFVDYDQSTPVVRIRDYAGSRQNRPSGSGKIGLSESSFEVQSWNTAKRSDACDHLLITGPTENFVYKVRDRANTSRMRRAPRILTGTETILVYEDKYDYDTSALKALASEIGVVAGEFARDAFKPDRTVCTTYRLEDAWGENEVVTKEVRVVYDGENNMMHKVETEYDYYDFKTPLGHTVKEYSRRPTIEGGFSNHFTGNRVTYDPASWEFELIKLVKVVFGDFIGETGMVETDIYTWNLLQYYVDTAKINGQNYEVLTGVKPVEWDDQIGVPAHEENSGYSKDIALWSIERLRFDEVSQFLLRKVRTITTMYPITITRTLTEDVPIKRTRMVRNQIERRWEYYWKNNALYYMEDDDSPPTGDFYPMRTLGEPDVMEESTAREIAYRQFTSRKEYNTMGTVKLVAPIPGLKIGMSVRMPQCTKRFWNYDTEEWDTADIESGTYWITGTRRVARYSGQPGSAQREIDAYDEIDIAENY